MLIITVIGDENSGKTTLLRQLYLNLCYGKDLTKLISYEPDGFDRCDFFSLLSVKNKVIAIKTLGDKNDETKAGDFAWVKDGIERAQTAKADILINALSTNLQEGKNKGVYNTLLPKGATFISYKLQTGQSVGEKVVEEEKLLAAIIKELKKNL